MIVSFDINLQIRRHTVLIEQIAEWAALHLESVAGVPLARRDPPIERVPLAPALTNPELRRLLSRPDRDADELELSPADLGSESIACLPDKSGIHFDRDDTISFVQVVRCVVAVVHSDVVNQVSYHPGLDSCFLPSAAAIPAASP